MVSLARGKVKIEPYRSEWVKNFEDEKQLIKAKIEKHIKDVQHIGSTSIVGLDSKPIIDIAIGVESLEDGRLCIEGLSELGYVYMNDAGVPGRHFFAKGVDECRTHYLHIEVIGGQLWKSHILFRDYLREHPEETEKYAKLKYQLAVEHESDRIKYTLGKEPFIKAIILKAEIEALSKL